jgi:polysaccharide export outer membrane protein
LELSLSNLQSRNDRHAEKAFPALRRGHGAACLVVLVLAGCRSGPSSSDVNPHSSFQFPGEAPVLVASNQPLAPERAAPAPGTAAAPAPVPIAARPAVTDPSLIAVAGASSVLLRVSDPLTITFSDLPPQMAIPEAKLRIGEDGMVTLPYNITVKAVGKTARQLEQEIRSEYVPRLFNYLTVTVKSEDRWYYVGGEVRNPNRQFYNGTMTVLRAIDTAGGFTDFANKKKIELRRSNGQKMTDQLEEGAAGFPPRSRGIPERPDPRGQTHLLVLQLTSLSGDSAGSLWVARRFPVRIGRAAHCHVRVEEAGLWDEHVEIEFDSQTGFVARRAGGWIAGHQRPGGRPRRASPR